MPKIPLPSLRDVRQEYIARYTPADASNGWPRAHVEVFQVEVDGTERLVYTYERGYSFLHTFEPFRQLQGDTWHDYALISSAYTTFQVLDLEAGQVVATRPYPQRAWHRYEGRDEYADNLQRHPEWFEPGGHYAGKGPDDTINAEGFCPVDFYVPDFATEMELTGKTGAEEAAKYGNDDFFQEELAQKTGQFAFYCGCVWGDDTSWKLRYIDLSKISEGSVTDDERFGYWELPSGRLRDLISYEDDFLQIPHNFVVELGTGEIRHAAKSLRWQQTPTD